ncbi:50S ribosomal protein L25 [Botrimarina sp.]|uniref:50S ribosomal protein L25 n=1 Tax=Botrimarina sp. TaxID=2795802 RepID=UPI0032EF1FED
MSDTLTATPRDQHGSLASRKLRASGSIPAVLYGHKEEVVSLAIPERELRKALAHKAKVVQLRGAADGQALVQDIQWDTFHRELLHVDLLRVSKGEKVQVSVPVELRGEAVGAQEGGVVAAVHDHVDIEAAPASIPDLLWVDVSPLKIGDNATAADLGGVPDGCVVLTEPERVLAHCGPPAREPDLGEAAAASDAPELITGEGASAEADAGEDSEAPEGEKPDTE